MSCWWQGKSILGEEMEPAESRIQKWWDLTMPDRGFETARLRPPGPRNQFCSRAKWWRQFSFTVKSRPSWACPVYCGVEKSVFSVLSPIYCEERGFGQPVLVTVLNGDLHWGRMSVDLHVISSCCSWLRGANPTQLNTVSSHEDRLIWGHWGLGGANFLCPM